ncbi:MAG: hypothetical protein V4576_03130 [Patescibacteria group bacterium]
MKTLFYTFRTNKHIPIFTNEGICLFTFGKLKEDFKKFEALIEKEKPTYIIGIAEVKTKTRIELKAVNNFGKVGKVSKNGKDSYILYIPSESVFTISKGYITSFCNWAMYKISELTEGKDIKNSFVHFNESDIPQLITLLKKTSPHL